MTAHDERLELGAYVLGGLEPDEREAFERHLRTCEPCQTELAELSGLPALLGRLPVTDVLSDVVGGPPETGPPAGVVMPGARPVHSRRAPSHRGSRPSRLATASRRRVATVAAAILIVVAGAVGVAVRMTSGTSPRPPATVALAAPAGGEAFGTAQMSPTTRGSDVQVKVTGIPPGTWCAVVLVRADGSTEQVGTWEASYTGTGGMSASTRLHPSQVRKVEIVRIPDRRTLLSGDTA